MLWYFESLKNDRKDPCWSDFRITAKNSVEHISPQTPDLSDGNRVSKEILDTFDNLALVSRSVNSEYSNRLFSEKREQFRNKNRDKLDSLKMALIYQNENWDDDRVNEHQREMIALIDKYLESQKKPKWYAALNLVA